MNIFKSKSEPTQDPNKVVIDLFFKHVKDKDVDQAQHLLDTHPELNLLQQKSWAWFTRLDDEFTPKDKQFTALEVCLAHGCLDMLALLLDRGAEITQTAMMIAATEYRCYTSSTIPSVNIEHIEMLTVFGADWNFKMKHLTCAQNIFMKACDEPFGKEDKMKLYELGFAEQPRFSDAILKRRYEQLIAERFSSEVEISTNEDGSTTITHKPSKPPFSKNI